MVSMATKKSTMHKAPKKVRAMKQGREMGKLKKKGGGSVGNRSQAEHRELQHNPCLLRALLTHSNIPSVQINLELNIREPC